MNDQWDVAFDNPVLNRARSKIGIIIK